MTRRYTNVKVWTEVRCMSDGHYWFRVSMDGGRTRSYSPECGFEGLGWYPTWEAPKYLIDETDRQIAAKCNDGSFTVYEHDQEGNRRYENLRYHDLTIFTWYAEHLGATK